MPRPRTDWAIVMLLAMFGLEAPSSLVAQDVEPNNTLAQASAIPASASGETLFGATLEPIPFEPLKDIRYEFHWLDPGGVNRHDFTGWPAGAPVAVYIDNYVGPTEPDTVMRALDPQGKETAFADDGSPLGNGYGTGFLTTYNADGSLHLEVTGFADYDFDGLDERTHAPHEAMGEYALVLKPGPFGDVDFYRLVGLRPGTAWTAETLAAPGSFPLDTILSQYDAAGELVAQNNDRDPARGDFLSALAGTVPADGQLILATTAHNDLTNVGLHLRGGGYQLRVTYEPVPEPAALFLVAGCGGSLAFCRRYFSA